ncbi:MAG: hypothetical protein PHO23_00330 [Candidatus Pacebacteria bacterium]|nr:hypothetical protein [Candidatus Paceibacterota bacterium]
MFKKLVIVFVVVNFLFCHFCHNAISSLGVDVPSTIKEDIYVLNYDKEIDTLYLMPSTSHNIYYATFFNCSSNSYFFKIKSNLETMKSLLNKEIQKNTLSPIYPRTKHPIFFYVSNFSYDLRLGYLVIEIFSLGGEKIKEFSIKKIIITKGTADVALDKPDFAIKSTDSIGIISNISNKDINILINIIKRNNVFFKKIHLTPQDKYFFTYNRYREEFSIVISSNNWMTHSSYYLSLNKNIDQSQTSTITEDKSIYWTQNKKHNIIGFLSFENVVTIFCYSEISNKINIRLKINNTSYLSQEYKIKQGWNKINLPCKNSLVESDIILNINSKEYMVEKVYIENFINEDKINFKFNNKISYKTNVKGYVRFMILTKQNGIIYLEELWPNNSYVPSYHREEKIIKTKSDYHEVVIVELTTSLDMIKPTLSE